MPVSPVRLESLWDRIMSSPSLYSELLTQYLENNKYSVFSFINKTHKLKNKNAYLGKGGEKQEIVDLEALR